MKQPAAGDRWLVAVGGNALADPHDPLALTCQEEKAAALAVALVPRLAAGIRIVLVHGNGPQVGARLIQNEAAAGQVPPSPLHICVAETQGQVGHYLVLAIAREARARRLDVPVVSLVTHVLVDREAPEFRQPDKPVGPVYDEGEAARLGRERGWQMAPVPGAGWRRVVASPRPLAVLEEGAAARLLEAGWCVVAGGGGGVPLTEGPDGLAPVDAVVDKDYTAQRLATQLGAGRLVVLTDVPGAAVSFGTRRQRLLETMSAKEAQRHLDAGEFAPGSMGPKVEACLAFLRAGGREAVIAATGDVAGALVGQAGTRLTLG